MSIKTRIKRCQKLFDWYRKDVRGVTAVAFALAIPVVVGTAGMAVDVSMAYMVKQRLGHALDSAALAAAAAASDGVDIQAKVQTFFDINYPPDKIGAAYNLQVTENGSDIEVSADAYFDTYFMRFLGINTLNVHQEATVAREITGLEVVMVVDVTGSMATNNNIQALRTASTNFVDILFSRTMFEDAVKIGIVPYTATVNVGPYGLGYDPDGGVYDDPFVNNPDNLVFDQSQKTQWWGCVTAQDYPDDTIDSDSSWMWDMYRFTFIGSSNYYYRSNYEYYDRSYGPNYICNKSYIVPLTSNQDYLHESINDFYPDGYTHGNLGMVWGYRVISPEAPFTEGADWEDNDWKKAVLMMTDGNNTMNSHYTAYGPYRWHSIGVTDLNERFAETCEAMKEQGITIYTVTFTSSLNSTTKQYYKECATDESKYFDAPGQADLIKAFETISRELSNIHLKE